MEIRISDRRGVCPPVRFTDIVNQVVKLAAPVLVGPVSPDEFRGNTGLRGLVAIASCGEPISCGVRGRRFPDLPGSRRRRRFPLHVTVFRSNKRKKGVWRMPWR